jgi:tRNA nucleotidyltransferase (CCA-adding enzyme)
LEEVAFFMKITLNKGALSIFKGLEAKLGTGNVFLVGGFVRDNLLNRESFDLDFATSLPPEKILPLFPEALIFSKYGTVSFAEDGYDITLACFRKESAYKDFRHPSSVSFNASLNEDALRRDFTINALYADSSLTVLDPTSRGLTDLKCKKLFLIGNSEERLKEDPLRILRAYRFSYELSFTFSEELERAIIAEKSLLKNLNPQKIVEEVNKAPEFARKKIINDAGLSFVYNNGDKKEK